MLMLEFMKPWSGTFLADLIRAALQCSKAKFTATLINTHCLHVNASACKQAHLLYLAERGLFHERQIDTCRQRSAVATCTSQGYAFQHRKGATMINRKSTESLRSAYSHDMISHDMIAAHLWCSHTELPYWNTSARNDGTKYQMQGAMPPIAIKCHVKTKNIYGNKTIKTASTQLDKSRNSHIVLALRRGFCFAGSTCSCGCIHTAAGVIHNDLLGCFRKPQSQGCIQVLAKVQDTVYTECHEDW